MILQARVLRLLLLACLNQTCSRIAPVLDGFTLHARLARQKTRARIVGLLDILLHLLALGVLVRIVAHRVVVPLVAGRARAHLAWLVLEHRRPVAVLLLTD